MLAANALPLCHCRPPCGSRWQCPSRSRLLVGELRRGTLIVVQTDDGTREGPNTEVIKSLSSGASRVSRAVGAILIAARYLPACAETATEASCAATSDENRREKV